jgi:hypothetical protein
MFRRGLFLPVNSKIADAGSSGHSVEMMPIRLEDGLAAARGRKLKFIGINSSDVSHRRR